MQTDQVDVIELPPREMPMYPTDQAESSRDLAMQVCQSIERSSLLEFTSSRVEELLDVLHDIIQQLDQLPDHAFRDLMQVILAMRDVRNELRLARFLFDVEERSEEHTSTPVT